MKAFFSVLDLKDHEAIRVLNVIFKRFLKKLSLNIYFKSIYVFFYVWKKRYQQLDIVYLILLPSSC